MHAVIGFDPFAQAFLTEDVATTLDLDSDMFGGVEGIVTDAALERAEEDKKGLDC